MNIQEKLTELQKIQINLLDFIDEENNSDDIFQNLHFLFDQFKIREDIHKLKSLLYLIVNISNDHLRKATLYSKIERVLSLFKNEIKQNYSNSEIFRIFESNKKLLLYVIKEEIMTVDEYFINRIKSSNYEAAEYPQYFLNEIQSFNTINNSDQSNEMQDNFEKNREIGENEILICQMIRNDSVEDFISYINRTNFSLNYKIKPTIYETNQFLINYKEVSLIEYAAFFGSIQIFQYLKFNKCQLNSLLWPFAIHGNNPEIIHMLEENHVLPIDKSYKQCLLESIKCHHNAVAKYIQDNYLKIDEFVNEALIHAIKYYNFDFIANNGIDESLFFYFCQFDHYNIVEVFLTNNEFDVNKKVF